MKKTTIEVHNINELREAVMQIVDSISKEIKEKEVKEKEEFIDNSELGDYFCKIASKWNWKPEKVNSYLAKLLSLCPTAAVNLILKEIAINLDKNYEGHISTSPHIYSISMLNGEIIEVDKFAVKNYRNFAAFREYEDAEYAKSLLQPVFNFMFDE